MTLPAHLQPVVERALQAAFGTPAYDAVTPLPAVRAFVCRIVAGGRAYLLRVSANTLVDPTFELAATRTAAAAGLAPHVWHADPAERVVITDFIDRTAFPADFALRLAPVIARIHALPAWPKAIHHLDMIDSFLVRLRPTGGLAGLDDVVEAYAALAARYPHDTDRVACHNDLKAPNLLFEGARVWVIDWEAAFVNDRYADLANAATFFVPEEDAAEAAFLAAYFGTPATAAQRARFVAARFANHVAYVALLSLLAPGAGVAHEPPDYRAFHDGIIDGTVDLSRPDAKSEYTAVHLAAARRAIASPRFAAALGMLGDR